MVDLSLTMVIQWINFGVLLWLLKKTLFGPVTRMLDKRAQDVHSLKEEAARDRNESQRYLAAAEENLDSARREAMDIVASARKVGFEQRDEIIEKAKGEAGGVLERAREEIIRQVAQARKNLKDETVRLSIAAAERILRREVREEDTEERVREFLAQVGEKA